MSSSASLQLQVLHLHYCFKVINNQFQHHLLKRLFFPHLIILAHLQKINSSYIWPHLKVFYLLLLTYMSILMLDNPQCLIPVALILEIRVCKSSNLVLFQIVLTLCPLHFPIKFRISLSVSSNLFFIPFFQPYSVVSVYMFCKYFITFPPKYLIFSRYCKLYCFELQFLLLEY